MRTRLRRLSFAMLALAFSATPAAADAGCPSHLTDGSTVCHLVGSGTDCKKCKYNCDGTNYTWNTCDIT